MPVSEKNNFAYLTVSLILLLFIAALVNQFPNPYGQRLVQAASVIILVAGVWSLKSSKLWFRSGLGFIIAIVLIFITGLFLELVGLSYLHLFIMLCFFVWTAVLAIKQVLFTGAIDGNKIIGSICIYFLLGLIWTLLYLLIAQVFPGAFNGIEQASWYENFSDVAYYSFVTLTTLGYGDISPVIPLARFLVYMEAVIGVFYLTILVASLVGARLTHLGPQQ